MLNSFYGLDRLDTGAALVAALAVGFFFGFALENAGFGSSRRLAGIFYFRDMTVLKVMFTGVITAMLGVCYLDALGVIAMDNIYLMPTIYAAQIAGGFVFGVGFAMSGWCPGTAAVGLASGSLDAVVFLVGAMAGSVLFNELFPLLKGLYTGGDVGVSFIYDRLGTSRAVFALLFSGVAVAAFWVAELVERKVASTGQYLQSRFLPAFSFLLLALAAGLLVLPPSPKPAAAVAASVGVAPASCPVAPGSAPAGDLALLAAVEEGADHLEPEDLADRLLAADPGLLAVDLRPPAEFAQFHLRGSVNAALPALPALAAANRQREVLVLYANGMTHAAQARDALVRLGHANVRLLTDGLAGFRERCLKPVSLRAAPVAADLALRIRVWREFFLQTAAVAPGTPAVEAVTARVVPPGEPLPGLVSTAWVAENLGRAGLKLLDVRPQPEYNSGHIPGALSVHPESFRGLVQGVPSMLLPAPMLAAQLSLLGLVPTDLVVVLAGDKLQDATLVTMALARVGHERYAVLQGGFAAWTAEKRSVDTILPPVTPSDYRPRPGADRFTVTATQLQQLQTQGARVLDVRPADFFAGRKSDEARAGHIPGAVNRPFSDDAVKGAAQYQPVAGLASVYAQLLPDRKQPVVVHCRTGNQASQSYFLLKHLLGYEQVFWYDAGWTEWAARPELPVVKADVPAAGK